MTSETTTTTALSTITESAESSGPFYLAEQRKAFNTEYFIQSGRELAPTPPPGDLELIHYPAPLGANVAYVTPPKPTGKHPAIVWIVGGFEWAIGPFAWERGVRADDQSGAVFRRAGIVQMYPSLRGQNDNPGNSECMLGEVDDIISAAEYLSSRPDVDPNRIYLGGHSTGGTLALLTAGSTDLFRAIFSWGRPSLP